MGRTLNKNKNPIAENTNQELQKEILRHTNTPGPITKLQLMLVLRNINSRIRYNGVSAKEVLFRRTWDSNTPIPVQDEELIEKQRIQRKDSSTSSHKNKLKTHAATEHQSFNIGDLVFLRNGKSKNSPRELHIVECKDDQYYLIRKFDTKLRERLYKALPDEMILAPSTKANTTVNDSLSNYPVNEDVKLNSKSGRPIRKAARKAHNIHKLTTLPPKNKPFLYGWKEEDQNSDNDTCFIVNEEAHTSNTSTVASSFASTSSDSEDQDYETDTELTWDFSPELVNLSTADDSFIDDNSPKQVTEPPSTSRRLATSEKPLERSNAFRDPPDVPPAPRKLPSASATSRQSRNPKPRNPADVNLHLVADISDLPLPEVTSYMDQEQQPQRAPGRRNVQQPTNYRVFHRTGFRNKGREER